MYNITHGYIVVLCFCQLTFGQSSEELSVIMDIKDYVQTIDSLKSWDNLKEIKVTNFTVKEALLSFYLKDNKPIKITLAGQNTNTEIVNSFYIRNEKLIYNSEQLKYYKEELSQHMIVAQETSESFFQGEKLLLQKDNYGEVQTVSQTYLDAAGISILDEYKVLRELLQDVE